MSRPRLPRSECGYEPCKNESWSSTGRYCSNQCQSDEANRIRVEKWLSDEITGLNTIGNVCPWLKKWLRETRGDKCEICGWAEINPVTGKVPVVADHIDGNHENNRPENLRLLCPNCDSLQPTYKALNKGNGRTWRRSQKQGSLAEID